MPEERITSPQNPRVKELVRLREGKHRRRRGVFLIEGLREIERAYARGFPIQELYLCEELWSDPATLDLIERLEADSSIATFDLGRDAFAKVSARENPDGLLAVGPVPDTGLARLSLTPNPLLLIVEHVEKPGNLGTLLRTADAAGLDAVIVTDPVTDLFNPNVIRASQGSIFAMQCAVAGNEETLAWLRERGICIVATTPGEGAILHWEANYRQPTAIVMGSEAEGLSSFWLNQPGITKAKIPMQGQADSLNVAAAAAIFMFEALRQRQGAA